MKNTKNNHNNPQSQFGAEIQIASRIKKLRNLIESNEIVRILEAHNGLTGIIVENTKVLKGKDLIGFDGIWISSLTDSTSRGKPDISIVDFNSKLITIKEILEATTKPVLVDLDDGGDSKNFVKKVESLEDLGVSGVVIEDKIGPKKNSLHEINSDQRQDSVRNFSNKIKEGKQSQIGEDFMIIARIESLILNRGVDDAIIRARSYIQAGADGILIHSKQKTPEEVLMFCDEYNKFAKNTPLFVVPTTYNIVREKELIKAGVNVVIYANHLLRSAYPSMVKTAEVILQNGRSFEANQFCMPIPDIINLIPFTESE